MTGRSRGEDGDSRSADGGRRGGEREPRRGDRATGRPRGLGPLLILSAGLPAAALWTGLRPGAPWATEVLILMAVAHGGAGGALFHRFRSAGGTAVDAGRIAGAGSPGDTTEASSAADGRTEAEGPPVGGPWLEGPAGRYLLFLAAVVFGAIEAHAIGVGIEGGAPRLALLLLVPPFAVAALALRGALTRVETEDGWGGGSG